MHFLPNGCKCSNLLVYPKNWKKGNKTLLNQQWRITYRFYDPKYEGTKLWGKPVTVRRMNEFKILSQRKQATEEILKDEFHSLMYEGFNPIDGTYNTPLNEFEYELDPDTPICIALDHATEKLDIDKRTKREIEGLKNHFNESCKMLGYDHFKICDIRRKQARAILDHLAKRKEYSNSRYNKVRTYIQMVFKRLVSMDVIEYNPISGIEKKKVVKKLRQSISDEDFIKVRKHLKINYYSFYRYTEIFFHSGSRNTELFRVKKEDVNLKAQTFKIIVLKGNQQTEELRAINNNVLRLWTELMEIAKPNDYIFSKKLMPGQTKIDSAQITRRWRSHVKKKLGINEDFYALKHKYLTKVIEVKGKNFAAGLAGHTSISMLDKHYDLNGKQRILDDGKNINISI